MLARTDSTNQPKISDIQPTLLDPDCAVLLGREIAQEQATPRQIAGIFAALMSCDDRYATEGVILGLIDGIGLEDPDACETIELYVRTVAQLYSIQARDYLPEPDD
jgi:hypothetical protein